MKRLWVSLLVLVLLALPLCYLEGTGLVKEAKKAEGAEKPKKVIKPVHAIAMHGKPKYGPDFKHFDYVNPKAPKGGRLKLGATGTFDSFHPLISKGNAASTGSIEALTVESLDESFVRYGLIAESLEFPKDRSWIIFNLRPQARWHDGVPITADDVVWTFETMMKKGTPNFRSYYADVKKVERLGKRRVKFSFKNTKNSELVMVVGEIPILPKHYWASRDFSKTTLEPPLGSGPYRIKDFEPGRYIVKERVKNYWGKDLPVKRGLDNFDEIRTNYYRDGTATRLALKSGNIDLRSENQAKAWAFNYNIEAVEQGWLKKELIPRSTPEGMQALVMNTRRREIFADRNVRQALNYAFDFEWTNKYLFHDQYVRTESYFANSELASQGPPRGEELDILNRYRDQLPPEIFLDSYKAPKTDGSGWIRGNLKTAFQLLEQSDWVVRDMKLVHKGTGKPMSFEILIVSPLFERVILPFIRNLTKLGIEARVRLVDQSQYINRIKEFDFDIIINGWGQSESPGNEQRIYWSSRAADMPASKNLAGIKDPIVDELIELLIQAKDRESLVMRTRALDRVLLAGYYIIPNWHLSSVRLLYWNRFSRPSKPVKMGATTNRWWYDEEKARALEKYMANQKLGVGEEAVSFMPWLAGLAILVVMVLFYRFGRFGRFGKSEHASKSERGRS